MSRVDAAFGLKASKQHLQDHYGFEDHSYLDGTMNFVGEEIVAEADAEPPIWSLRAQQGSLGACNDLKFPLNQMPNHPLGVWSSQRGSSAIGTI